MEVYRVAVFRECLEALNCCIEKFNSTIITFFNSRGYLEAFYDERESLVKYPICFSPFNKEGESIDYDKDFAKPFLKEMGRLLLPSAIAYENNISKETLVERYDNANSLKDYIENSLDIFLSLYNGPKRNELIKELKSKEKILNQKYQALLAQEGILPEYKLAQCKIISAILNSIEDSIVLTTADFSKPNNVGGFVVYDTPLIYANNMSRLDSFGEFIKNRYKKMYDDYLDSRSPLGELYYNINHLSTAVTDGYRRSRNGGLFIDYITAFMGLVLDDNGNFYEGDEVDQNTYKRWKPEALKEENEGTVKEKKEGKFAAKLEFENPGESSRLLFLDVFDFSKIEASDDIIKEFLGCSFFSSKENLEELIANMDALSKSEFCKDRKIFNISDFKANKNVALSDVISNILPIIKGYNENYCSWSEKSHLEGFEGKREFYDEIKKYYEQINEARYKLSENKELSAYDVLKHYDSVQLEDNKAESRKIVVDGRIFSIAAALENVFHDLHMFLRDIVILCASLEYVFEKQGIIRSSEFHFAASNDECAKFWEKFKIIEKEEEEENFVYFKTPGLKDVLSYVGSVETNSHRRDMCSISGDTDSDNIFENVIVKSYEDDKEKNILLPNVCFHDLIGIIKNLIESEFCENKENFSIYDNKEKKTITFLDAISGIPIDFFADIGWYCGHWSDFYYDHKRDCKDFYDELKENYEGIFVENRYEIKDSKDSKDSNPLSLYEVLFYFGRLVSSPVNAEKYKLGDSKDILGEIDGKSLNVKPGLALCLVAIRLSERILAYSAEFGALLEQFMLEEGIFKDKDFYFSITEDEYFSLGLNNKFKDLKEFINENLVINNSKYNKNFKVYDTDVTKIDSIKKDSEVDDAIDACFRAGASNSFNSKKELEKLIANMDKLSKSEFCKSKENFYIQESNENKYVTLSDVISNILPIIKDYNENFCSLREESLESFYNKIKEYYKKIIEPKYVKYKVKFNNEIISIDKYKDKILSAFGVLNFCFSEIVFNTKHKYSYNCEGDFNNPNFIQVFYSFKNFQLSLMLMFCFLSIVFDEFNIFKDMFLGEETQRPLEIGKELDLNFIANEDAINKEITNSNENIKEHSDNELVLDYFSGDYDDVNKNEPRSYNFRYDPFPSMKDKPFTLSSGYKFFGESGNMVEYSKILSILNALENDNEFLNYIKDLGKNNEQDVRQWLGEIINLESEYKGSSSFNFRLTQMLETEWCIILRNENFINISESSVASLPNIVAFYGQLDGRIFDALIADTQKLYSYLESFIKSKTNNGVCSYELKCSDDKNLTLDKAYSMLRSYTGMCIRYLSALGAYIEAVYPFVLRKTNTLNPELRENKFLCKILVSRDRFDNISGEVKQEISRLNSFQLLQERLKNGGILNKENIKDGSNFIFRRKFNFDDIEKYLKDFHKDLEILQMDSTDVIKKYLYSIILKTVYYHIEKIKDFEQAINKRSYSLLEGNIKSYSDLLDLSDRSEREFVLECFKDNFPVDVFAKNELDFVLKFIEDIARDIGYYDIIKDLENNFV